MPNARKHLGTIKMGSIKATKPAIKINQILVELTRLGAGSCTSELWLKVKVNCRNFTLYFTIHFT